MKYTTKRIEVDAVQFVNSDEPLPAGVERGHEARYAGDSSDQSFFRHKYGPIYSYFVDTGSGKIQIRPGEWVVTLEDGSRCPYSNEDFEKCFDLASEHRSAAPELLKHLKYAVMLLDRLGPGPMVSRVHREEAYQLLPGTLEELRAVIAKAEVAR